MQNNLSAKIKAVNRVHAYIKAKAPAMIEALKPFVGKKVFLASGEVSAKVREVLAPFFAEAREHNVQIYRSSSIYSLAFVFKVSEPTGEFGCIYHEASVYMLDLERNSGTATKAYEFNPEHFPSKFQETDILALRKELEAAQAEVRRLESSLGSFLNVR